jgi:hypothetical protein
MEHHVNKTIYYSLSGFYEACSRYNAIYRGTVMLDVQIQNIEFDSSGKVIYE